MNFQFSRGISSICIVLLLTAVISGSAFGQTKTYTLEECIQLALGTDFALIQTQDNYRKAKAGVMQAWGAFLPSIDASLSRDYNNIKNTESIEYITAHDPVIDSFVTVPVFSDTYESHTLRSSLTARYTLFDGFGKFTYLSYQRANVAATKHQLSSKELEAIYKVKSRYYDLLKSQALLDITKKAVERSEQLMKISETKYELGSASKSDVLKARVSLSEAQLELLKANNWVETAQANLNYSIGEPVDQKIVIEEINNPQIDIQPDEIRNTALMSNPTYLAAQASVQSARRYLQYSRKDYLPSLTVRASRTWSKNKSSTYIVDEWKKPNSIYLEGLLSLNIFNGFSTRRNTENAKADLHTSEYSLLDSKRSIELEARASYLNFQEKSKAIELAKEKFASAQEDYKFAQEKYTLGAATILDILNAELSLKTAESDKIESKYDYYLAVARLKKVMGIAQ